MSTELGRIPDSQTVVLDDEPSQKVSAMLRKQDELIDAIQGLAAKLDADATVTDTDYAALWTDALAKLDLDA